MIVLYATDDEVNETEWLQAAARTDMFSDLADPAEDIYSLSDGQPFYAEI